MMVSTEKERTLTVRRRRSAEESQTLILQVAAKRLAEHGLEGLNITGVAKEAGISHATLIHHFGSSGGMREALGDKMILDLVDDLVAAFEKDQSRTEMIRNVFHVLTAGGHAKLIAWRAVQGSSTTAETDAVAAGFKKLLSTMQSAVKTTDETDVRNLILLVGIAAVGYGLAGDVLSKLIGMDQDDLETFPAWMTNHIS